MRFYTALLLLGLGAVAAGAADRLTIVVGPIGADFPTVQAAIDAVPADNAQRPVIGANCRRTPAADFGGRQLQRHSRY